MQRNAEDKTEKQRLEEITKALDERTLKKLGKPIKILKAGNQDIIIWEKNNLLRRRLPIGKEYTFSLTIKEKEAPFRILSQASLVDKVTEPGVAKIVGVHTIPGFNRQGLNRAIQEAIYNKAVDLKLKKITLVPSLVTRSHKYYDKLGFSVGGLGRIKEVGKQHIEFTQLKQLEKHIIKGPKKVRRGSR